MGTCNLESTAVIMVIEMQSFCLGEKNVVNSRFGLFLFCFQDTFADKTRKTIYVYTKLEQQIVYSLQFCNLFLFNSTNLNFLKDNITFHEHKLSFLESTFCALFNEMW